MRSSGRNVTIKDVAKLADCSLGTVSRVVNGSPSVSEKTQIRVRKAMEQLNYKPNAVARSMRTQKTQAVGFIVNEISNPLFSHIATAAEELLMDRQQLLVLGNTSNDPARELELIRSLDGRQVDGFIIAVSDEKNKDVFNALSHLSVPVVLLDRELDKPFDAVLSDHATGIETAVSYLVELGHRSIALITGGDQTRPGRERLIGYKKACSKHGIPYSKTLVRTGFMSAQFGYEEACNLFSGEDRPTAIIAGGNQILVGVMRAIKLFKLSVPEDISLIACDETELSELADPAITVISRDLKELGRTAAQMLARRLGEQDGPAATRKIVLPTELIVRSSCSRPRSIPA
jgi:LacI family transcriptional regulator